MKERTFDYKGRKYEPIGNFKTSFLERYYYVFWKTSYNNEIKNIDKNDFYKVAKKNKASCDIYRIDDSEDYYILGEDTFYLVLKKACIRDNKIKYCEEYLRWYKSSKPLMKENELRSVCFIDDLGNHAYYKTNTPKEVLCEALDDMMFKVDSASALIDELTKKGYLFVEQEEIESYGVYNL